MIQATAAPPTAIPTIARRLNSCMMLISVVVHVIAHGDVAILVDDDWSSFFPSRAIVFDPNSSGPLADVVSSRENTGSLDITNFDDVFVFGEDITELLTCGTMTHCTVDVFKDFCGVSRSFA